MFEGGLISGLIVYLALFNWLHQMLYRIGLIASAAPRNIAFGGLLAATCLANIHYGGSKHRQKITGLTAMSGLTLNQAGHGSSS
jgi:hypothetical protein